MLKFLVPIEREVNDMIHLFTQEEVDEIEWYNMRQAGRQESIRFYAVLVKKLSALGRTDDLISALGNLDKLEALAKEFGLEM